MKRQPRRGYTIDKVALVSLPLIILIFLLLTTRPKTWFNSSVDLPEAEYFTISDTDGDYAHILLKNGKCSLVIDSALRALSLTTMGKQHGIIFNQKQIDKFSQIKVFGASMKKMNSFIETHAPPTEKIDERFGIPIDSANEELSGWIKVANEENQKRKSSPLHIALLCDKNEPYSNVKLIRDALRKDSIYRIAVIYNSKPMHFNH